MTTDTYRWILTANTTEIIVVSFGNFDIGFEVLNEA